MSKKVLLSGIGGSISAHFLAHIMSNTDWHVVGVDSFRHKGWMDRVTEVTKEHEDWKKRITIITHDLNAPFSQMTKKKMGKIDIIISMASLSDVEASIQDPVPFIQNNVALAINMLEYAREAKPEVFIQISTDEVYGASSSKFDDLRKEWDAIIPSNPYAASKACQEAIAISYWRTYGVPLVITNTMNNADLYQQSSKYPVIIQKALMRDEEITIHGKPGLIGSRSYISSINFADAVLFIIKNCTPYMHVPNSADRPDRYNIAGTKQLDNLELAQEIAQVMGKELKYKFVDSHTARPGHDPHYGLDSTKLYKLGWSPVETWEESLKRIVTWQTAHPEWLE